jgi:hypothetical protein
VLLSSNLILGSSIVASIVFSLLPEEDVDKMISIPGLLGHVNEVRTLSISPFHLAPLAGTAPWME